jgi:hypothetical protein
MGPENYAGSKALEMTLEVKMEAIMSPPPLFSFLGLTLLPAIATL